jgi:hypothetical protein
LSFDDLFVPQTEDEAKDFVYAEAATLGLSTDTWQEGDPTRTLIAIDAKQVYFWTSILALVAGGAFLEKATGEWLKLLARNVYQVEPIAATFASAADAIQLTNSGTGTYTFDAEEVTVYASGSGKTYKVTEGGTLTPDAVLTLDCRADEVGASSNAQIGEIDSLQTTMLGVTVTNVRAVVGRDAESEDEIRERCRDSLAAKSPNGAAAAYEYFAITSSDGTALDVDVDRVLVLGDTDTGDVTVYIAAPSGAVTSDDRDAVEANIAANCVPTGITPTVLSATPLTTNVTAELWVSSAANLNTGQVEALVEDGLSEWFRDLPIGGVVISPATGKIYRDALKGAIFRSIPIPGTFTSYITNLTVSSPSADVDVDQDEVPICGTVSLTVNFV